LKFSVLLRSRGENGWSSGKDSSDSVLLLFICSECSLGWDSKFYCEKIGTGRGCTKDCIEIGKFYGVCVIRSSGCRRSDDCPSNRNCTTPCYKR